LVTYPKVRNNLAKARLIPDVFGRLIRSSKAQKALREGPMPHQLVGRVTAYQGYDEYRV